MRPLHRSDLPPRSPVTWRVVLIATTVLCGPARAQDHEIGAAPEPSPDTGAAHGPLQRLRYSGLFPFYTHEELENGYDKKTVLFHALRFDRGPGPEDRYDRAQWQRELVAQPFFSSFSDESADESSFRVLGIVYHAERSGGRVRRSIFFIPIGGEG